MFVEGDDGEQSCPVCRVGCWVHDSGFGETRGGGPCTLGSVSEHTAGSLTKDGLDKITKRASGDRIRNSSALGTVHTEGCRGTRRTRKHMTSMWEKRSTESARRRHQTHVAAAAEIGGPGPRPEWDASKRGFGREVQAAS